MKYVVGVDFGTLSARALVVAVDSGREIATATMDYPHGVLDATLPSGERLKPDWALQHPGDYLLCLKTVARAALEESGVDPKDVVGVGIDCTACTLLAVDSSGTPLCLTEAFAANPHAWVKLWKHHGAQREADEMTRIARERGEEFLSRYGGKISSEWMLPKIWNTLNEAPEVYHAAHRFIDAGDWIVSQLTGSAARSASVAGYKALWSPDAGYPSKEYLNALDPRLTTLAADKLAGEVLPLGAKAGELTEEGARLMGLCPGTAVAVSNIDAHVAMPATGAVEPGSMLMIMGTSTCDIMLARERRAVPGMCGAVDGGVVQGLYGYEAGQSCVGDLFQWFVENCVPADMRGADVHASLTARAAQLQPGESGLLALDWWNGNRSVLVDANLSGMMIGMTLATRPEEIYRALFEATAFGARVILDAFEDSGVSISSVVACGGIAKKNPLLMQIYADILDREIRIVRSAQAPALGASMFGAVAAGSARGGYDDIADAARAMGGVEERAYRPIPANAAVYRELYREYRALHDWYGRGGSDAMKRLRALRDAAIND
ncbi:MAG: ribulokinase [Christensenellales bacterium]|jgi:L-ribulokinase